MPVRHLWRHDKTSNLSSAYQIIHGGWFSVWICFESFSVSLMKCIIIYRKYNCVSAIDCIWIFGVSAGAFSTFTRSDSVRLEDKAVITFFTIEEFHILFYVIFIIKKT